MRVFLACPANMATGGTELLHQFSKCLSDCGIENYMIYPDRNEVSCPTPESFLKYGVKNVTRYIDASDSVLILAETQINLLNACQKGTLMLWWLSVDNYLHTFSKKIQGDNVDAFHLKERKNLIHFVQSHYAKDFVNCYFSRNNCYFLMDYINDDIVNYALANRDNFERQNICLYNPRKGYEAVKPIISACREDITWVPLVNMSPIELADAMCKAKVYIDFGAHPGKDRIPREAAVCGCCVITNKQGSAAYNEDVPIPERYKIEDTSDVDTVLEKLYDLMDHYDERTVEYEDYRERIVNEKADFLRDAQTAVSIMQAKVVEKETVELPATNAQILDSISHAAKKISELAEQSKTACGMGNLSKTMNGLLTIDYVLQVMRETVYEELIDMADR